MHYEDICNAVNEIFPNAGWLLDDDNQLVIYTDFFLSETEDDTYYPGSEA